MSCASNINTKRTLERTLWVGSDAFGSLNTWGAPEYGKVERSIQTYLPLIGSGDDSLGTLTNSRGDLRKDRLSVASEYQDTIKAVSKTHRDVWRDNGVHD